MSDPVFPGRFTAETSNELILFRIGMRFNGWRGVVPAVRTAFAMPFMLAEQQTNASIGMLSTSTAVSWPVLVVTQFWRSYDDLHHYSMAQGGKHTRLMRWFNKLGRRGLGTGIWHEIYHVAPGSHEATYVNMPRYGLAAAARHVPLLPPIRNSEPLPAQTADSMPDR